MDVLVSLDRHFDAGVVVVASIFIAEDGALIMKYISIKLPLCFVFLVLILANKALAAPPLICSSDSLLLVDAYVSRSSVPGGNRYDYIFSYADSFWTGVVYEFKPPITSNFLTARIVNSDKGKKLTEQLFFNTKQKLLDENIAETVSKPTYHRIPEGAIATFKVSYGVENMTYAIFGWWSDNDLNI
ncbi:hypothetical protein, partial [Marinobacter caseinilyticus]|uniref:hypothetical protein n=1 Tax=Marinobacter caseinilyticus TaxID=2692195 RepID=UPI00140786FE